MMNKVHLREALAQAEEEKLVHADQRRGESQFHHGLVLRRINALTDRPALVQQLHARIKSIRGGVDELMQHVQHPQAGQMYIETLKRLMESIESDLIVFKESQREQYDHLLHHEKRLTQEVATLEEHVAAWEHQSTNESLYEAVSEQSTTAPKKRKATDPQSQLLPEAVAFQDYLARHGGHTGGWDQLMHNHFVKVRQKHKGNGTAFFRECVSSIPGVTLESATSHERWYRGYCKLRDARKAAIGRPMYTVQGLLAKQAEQLDKKVENERHGKERNTEEENRVREEKKKEIDKWKEEQKRKAEEVQRAAKEEARRQREAQKVWRQEHEKAKHKVSEYVQKRSHEQALLRRVEEEAKRIQKAARGDLEDVDVERLAQRNEAISQKKRQLMEAKAQAEQQKEKRIERLRASVESMIIVDRDPARLLQPTEAAKQKVQGAKDAAEVVKGKFRPPVMPKRHVPNWRQGL
ncbi:hypothetical protein HDV00_011086 [Rhizophlyctis rosea]|nr:hypothetical protein HDV00_011086 [Rhizophlyctis rosea]